MYRYRFTRFQCACCSRCAHFCYPRVAHVLRAWTTENWRVQLCDWKWTSMPTTIIVSTWKWPTGLACPTATEEPLTGERTVQASHLQSIKSVPQETATQFRRPAYGRLPKISKRQLQEGDLVFFHNGRRKRVANHVGIYLKDGKFVHASTSSGVIVSRLEEPYYRKCWMQGGRVKGL